MAQFGKHPSSSTPAPVVTHAPVGGAGPAKGALAFSFPGLLGALAVSTAITLIGLNHIIGQFQELVAANPDVAKDLAPGELGAVTQIMRWVGAVMFGLLALGYCFLAHRASKYFDNGEFWLFALVGLLSAFVVCIVTGALPGPIRGAAYYLIHGVAVTSTYWLTANRREA